MMDLYMFMTANSWRCSIALEELELPFTVRWINLRERENMKPEYLAKNPLGRVPMIEDSDGPDGTPVSIYTSPAIVIYAAEKAGRLFPVGGNARAVALEWLMFAVTDLGMAFDFRFRYETLLPRRGDAPDPYAIEDTGGLVARYMTRAEQRLGEAEYFAGDYSIADIAVIPFVAGPRAEPEFLDPYPNVRRWADRVAARPAVQRGFRTIEL